MNVFVTGGAGYVGSIVGEELSKKGYSIIVLDNLRQGHRKAVLPEVKFIEGDLANIETLDHVFQGHKIDAVMHMAAETVVEHSMTDPRRYFQNNVVNGLNLLDTMLKYDVKRIIFSSSAAVYGEPIKTPIKETHPRNPVNSYGESKLMFEKILNWYQKAYGIKYVSLRYFNAAGASEKLGEDHNPETHLIPLVLKCALNFKAKRETNQKVKIFGTDYSTKDGTCIRANGIYGRVLPPVYRAGIKAETDNTIWRRGTNKKFLLRDRSSRGITSVCLFRGNRRRGNEHRK